LFLSFGFVDVVFFGLDLRGSDGCRFALLPTACRLYCRRFAVLSLASPMVELSFDMVIWQWTKSRPCAQRRQSNNYKTQRTNLKQFKFSNP